MANILTISIGSMSIKLCEVSYSGNNIHLHKAAVIKTPEDSVEDGFIKDEKGIVDAISASIKINKFEAKTAIFTIFSSRIASKEIVAPDVKDKKLTQIITANASEYFPVNIEDYIITHTTLEKVEEENAKQLRVLVLAAPKEIVMSCYAIGYQLGLYVERVDYAGNSAIQVAKREIGPENALLIQIQEDNTIISILKNNILQLQRIVPYGKAPVVQALAEEKNIDMAAAEEVLATEKIIHEQFDDDFVTDTLKYLVNSIARVVDYYVSRHQGERIEKAYLTGASTELMGIDKLFANEFGFDSTENLTMKNVVLAAELKVMEEITGKFIANLGAGILPTDFIPTEEIEKVNKEVDFKLLNLALFGSVLIAIVIVTIPLIQYMSAKTARDNMQARVDEVIEVESILTDYYIALDKAGDAENYYEMTQTPNDALRNFIRDLEEKMPSDIALGSVSADAGNISIAGTASSKDSVAKLILELKSLDYVFNVYSGSLSEAKDENGKIEENFSITCALYDTSADAAK